MDTIAETLLKNRHRNRSSRANVETHAASAADLTKANKSRRSLTVPSTPKHTHHYHHHHHHHHHHHPSSATTAATAATKDGFDLTPDTSIESSFDANQQGGSSSLLMMKHQNGVGGGLGSSPRSGGAAAQNNAGSASPSQHRNLCWEGPPAHFMLPTHSICVRTSRSVERCPRACKGKIEKKKKKMKMMKTKPSLIRNLNQPTNSTIRIILMLEPLSY